MQPTTLSRSLPPPCRHTHKEKMLTHATAAASTALIPEWEEIYFKKWHEHLPLPEVRRKGKNLTLVLQSASGLACPHSRYRSHLSASSDTEALDFPCTLHSGNSLFFPLADIFIHLVKFPPTQTPTHDGYGKNTAKLGIHPWENWNLDHILLRITRVCYLSGTCQRGNSSGEHAWKCPPQPALLPLHKQHLLNVLTPISYCPYCRFYVFFMLCLWFYSLLSCTFINERKVEVNMLCSK